MKGGRTTYDGGLVVGWLVGRLVPGLASTPRQTRHEQNKQPGRHPQRFPRQTTRGKTYGIRICSTIQPDYWFLVCRRRFVVAEVASQTLQEKSGGGSEPLERVPHAEGRWKVDLVRRSSHSRFSSVAESPPNLQMSSGAQSQFTRNGIPAD